MRRKALATIIVQAALVLAVMMPAYGANPDVGLVTLVSGEVTYTGAGEGAKPSKAQAFMKIRQGDRLKVPEGASLKLVYFASQGRQELWKGPVELVVDEDKAQGKGPGGQPVEPEVSTLPTQVSGAIGGSSIPGLGRSGLMQVRGGPGQATTEPEPLTEQDRADLARARETYLAMKKTAGAEDLTPELYLLNVLADYDQYQEMADLLKKTRARQPENATLKELEAWVAARLGRGK